jgi:hypothetical protein
MRMWAILAGLLAGVTAASAGEKIQDRHPAMTAPVALPPAPQPVQNAPTGSAAPVEPRPVRTVVVTIRKPDQETCKRHGRRTVWSGNSWSCRR